MIERRGNLDIIIGPCSIIFESLTDIYRLAEIRVSNLKGEKQPAFWGTRMVGLKSRTELDPTGKGMGIDYSVIMENILILANGGSVADLLTPPSVKMASEVVKNTGLVIGTEIMEPLVQMPVFEKTIPDTKLFAWSPSVQQLGWPIIPMAVAAQRHNWELGIKNGKWRNMEKTWLGLAVYANKVGLDERNITLIHRGIDVPEKGDYRNLPVHEAAQRARQQWPGVRIYFDPSHSCGPKLRDKIIEETVKAMLMQMSDGRWLYDGALIEAGSSPTDTDQHLSINEAQCLAEELAKFRELNYPKL